MAISPHGKAPATVEIPDWGSRDRQCDASVTQGVGPAHRPAGLAGFASYFSMFPPTRITSYIAADRSPASIT